MREHEKLAYAWGIPIAILLLAVVDRYYINADRTAIAGIQKGQH